MEGVIIPQDDKSHKMCVVEVRNASSAIHLGHVCNHGPLFPAKCYCINGKLTAFVPDPG